MSIVSVRLTALALIVTLALVTASCRDVSLTDRPAAQVTVISATTEAPTVPAPQPTAEPPTATVEPQATTAESTVEVVAAADADEPEPPVLGPLGADLELVPGVTAYNLGEAIITQERFPEDSRFRAMPVRLEGIIALPDDLQRPAPLALILHGNHRGCPTDPERHGVDPWPCSPEEEQHNYQGFDYLVRALADQGFVAVAINVNGEYTLGFGEGDLGERMGQIIERHLAALGEASRGGVNEFGVDLEGRLDLGRLAFIGHSMGGEIGNWLTHREGWDSPYSMVENGFGPVAGLLLLAPSNNVLGSTGGSVPTAALLPKCDGDVVLLDGQSFYETLRQDPTFSEWAGTVLMERANHNGFNRILRTDNSRIPGCETVLPAADQQKFLVEYAQDFLKALWAAPPEQTAAAARLGLDAVAPAPTQLYGLPVQTVTMLPQRQTLLAAVSETEVEAALSGGGLRVEGADVLFCPPGFMVTSENPIAELCRRPNFTQPGNPAQLVVSWTAPGAALRFNLGDGERDLSAFSSLRLRAAVDPLSDLNEAGLPQSFRVVLTDANGRTADFVVPGSVPALQYPLGEREDMEFLEEGFFSGLVHMSDIRVPLSVFDAIDLTNVATVEIQFDQTNTGSLLLADIEFIRPEQVIGAYSSLLENANGVNDALSGIGRLNGPTTCTAVFIDVGGESDAPAYALTNGHCAQPWDANEVFTDLPANTINVTFNYFVDTTEQSVTARATRAVYSTMKGRDVAILELATTAGDLAAQGIKPLPLAAAVPEIPFEMRVVGAPVSGVPSAIAYLREEACRASGTADLFEFIWHFDDTIRSGCQDIYGGSSGSPVFAGESNAVVALMNTTNIGGFTPCASGVPCEVTAAGTRVAPDTSYATPVSGLDACFANGRFELDLPDCPLDRGEQLTISGYPTQPIQPTSPGTDGQPVAAAWDAILSGTQPFYRYKTGPAGSTDCRDESGYGDVLAVSIHQVIADRIPTQEGSYVLCVIAGPTPEVDASWQSAANATAVRAEIDTTPPQIEPFVNILRLGDQISIEPVFVVPELSDFSVKVGPPDSTDCQSDVDYFLYRRVPIQVAAEDLPVVVCVVGRDMAGNAAPPFQQIVGPLQ